VTRRASEARVVRDVPRRRVRRTEAAASRAAANAIKAEREA
jgi:hypothetical protein